MFNNYQGRFVQFLENKKLCTFIIIFYYVNGGIANEKSG
jgi:hypothetical protein